MLTTFSKVLAVATAAVSLLALGVVLVTASGGPNWQAEAIALKEYEITENPGEVPTWTSKTRRPRVQQGAAPAQVTVAQNVATLPEAIIKSYEASNKEATDEIAQLDREIPILQARIREAQELIEKDLAGLKKREELLLAERNTQAAEIDRLVKESIAKSQDVQTIRRDLEKRRDDVFRLRNELDAIRVDRYRLKEQTRQLSDLLVRMNGTNDRLERRAEQLEANGAVDPGYDPEKKAEPEATGT